MLPMYKVLAHSMAPMHRSPDNVFWIILIKKMVYPFIINQPIGIVHPFLLRGKVPLRSIGLVVKFLSAFFIQFNLPDTCFADQAKCKEQKSPAMSVFHF